MECGRGRRPLMTYHKLAATRGLFWDGPRNLEPCSDGEGDTPLSKRSRRTSGRTFGSDGFIVYQTRLHGSSWMESGLVPETLWPRSRDLITKPLRNTTWWEPMLYVMTLDQVMLG
ncbi:hypothetical protein AVEN_74787-1 [Araneus ventricosus]|uniref:Uncharacterized protein n=1 Tax=Araneus ventricosus TaxID=182803 RepID=A0A4Y2T5T9_ARAVE|nr:hypothetical protein AVEN_74787-1 [Araneus ventricosus]